MTVQLRLLALVLGFLLDLLWGDPSWAPHPVRGMGALISLLEGGLRRVFPKTPGGERLAGLVLVALVLGISTGAALLLLMLCGRVSLWLAFGVETLLCYQMLAARSLRDESTKVYRALTQGTLEDARRAVSMIVGRDTQRLDEQGVVRAAVETVAENASDGVVAPLLFLALGGAPLGVLYKAANTMDSMVGYRNEKYLNFGRCAARLDDILNFLPARIAGVLMCLGAALAGFDGRNAWRIFRRDRKNHKSPNSAHTEAATAGALHVRLAGNNYYFGQLVEKPTIGDDDRPVEPGDILGANRIMYATALLCLLLCAVIPLLALWR
jgi:adenosylcobinamide-phosphate synthase